MMRRLANRLSVAITGALILGSAHLPAQEVVGHSTEQTGNHRVLTLDLEDGNHLVLEVRDGKLLLNGTPIAPTGGAYGSAEEMAAMIQAAAAQSTAEVMQAMAEREVAIAELRAALAELETSGVVYPEIAATAEPDAPTTADVVIRQARSRGVAVGQPAELAVGNGSASFVGGLAIGAANLVAVFIALSFMGLGFLFFAPKQLETVADTVWHSFWRSFLAGLFAQPLVLPAFGMMLVGLVLTVVGILVVPFAVVGFAAALFLAAVGGFIAVARSVGEVYLRRKMARGEPIETWGSYRYIVYGLVGLMAVWLPVVLLGWIPVAGTLLTVSAVLITWMMATAGFGATIISRAGMRGTFVRQLDLALTDEQYWTADAMPAPPQSGRIVRR